MPCILCGREEKRAAVEEIVCSLCFNHLATLTGRKMLNMIEKAEQANQIEKAKILKSLMGRSYHSVQKLRRRNKK